jgi:hypothetical protein
MEHSILDQLAILTHRVGALEANLEQAWAALGDLGCESCQVCGAWWHPTTNPTRGCRVLEEGPTWICDCCLPDWWAQMRETEPEHLPSMTVGVLTWLVISGQVDGDTRGSMAPFATLQGACYTLAALITRLQKRAMEHHCTLQDALVYVNVQDA